MCRAGIRRPPPSPRRWRAPWLLALAAAALLARAAHAEFASVFFPRGACSSGWLELELWDRDDTRWVPHPVHPRIPVDSCQLEESERLLNELRVRCIDPTGARPPSDWVVGTRRLGAGESDPCAGAPAPP